MWCQTRAWSQSGPGEKGNAMFRLLSEVIENFTYRETKLLVAYSVCEYRLILCRNDGYMMVFCTLTLFNIQINCCVVLSFMFSNRFHMHSSLMTLCLHFKLIY